MVHDADEMLDMIGSVATDTERVSEDLKTFIALAKETRLSAGNNKNVIYAALIKLGHMIYKQNGYQAFLGGPDSTTYKAIMVDHHDCKLGKWYYGDAKSCCAHLPHFAGIENPHRRVHSHVQQAVAGADATWASNKSIQDEILEHYQQAERASMDLMDEMDRLVEDQLAELRTSA